MEMKSPLESLSNYSQYIADTVNRQSVLQSTLCAWSMSPFTGIAEGEVIFRKGFRLRMREEIDFDEELITSYGYEIYQDNNRLYWYDDFPHPDDQSLASTYPHHKHILPDIKRNRIPAPEINYKTGNLSFLIEEIENQIKF